MIAPMQGRGLLPLRANPVAGALIATIVFAAVVALPVLILGLVVWMVVRASRSSPSPARQEGDDELSTRFHELEESILNRRPERRGVVQPSAGVQVPAAALQPASQNASITPI
jgi:hypothetical protein